MTIEQMKERGMNNLVLITHWKEHSAGDALAGAMLAYFLVEKLKIFNDLRVGRVDGTINTSKGLKTIYETDGDYCMMCGVGGEYDPKHGMFDYHQHTRKEGGRASAGMVFDWLISEGVINETLKRSMEPIVKLVDDDDMGVTTPIGGIPWAIKHMNIGHHSIDEEHDAVYIESMYFMSKIVENLEVSTK